MTENKIKIYKPSITDLSSDHIETIQHILYGAMSRDSVPGRLKEGVDKFFDSALVPQLVPDGIQPQFYHEAQIIDGYIQRYGWDDLLERVIRNIELDWKYRLGRINFIDYHYYYFIGPDGQNVPDPTKKGLRNRMPGVNKMKVSEVDNNLLDEDHIDYIQSMGNGFLTRNEIPEEFKDVIDRFFDSAGISRSESQFYNGSDLIWVYIEAEGYEDILSRVIRYFERSNKYQIAKLIFMNREYYYLIDPNSK